MKRPKLRYAYNEALINTYAEELEKYCDEIEKALDKACDVIVELNTCNNLVSEEYLHCPLEQKCNNRCIEEKRNNRCISNKENWKEWCMKDE